MHDGARGDQSASVLQVLGDQGVRLLERQVLEVGDLGCEPAVVIHGHGDLARLHEPILDADRVIVLSEAGGAMNDACTCVGGDELAGDDSEALLLTHLLEVVEEGGVLLADEVLPLDLVEDLVVFDLVLLAHVLESGLGHDVDLLGLQVLQLEVDEAGVDGAGQVGRECPGGGGPRNQVHLGLVDQGEGHVEGGVLGVLVVGARLEVGEHGVAGGGEGHDARAAVDEALVKDGLEGPPHGLHEFAVHRLVVVLEVDPPSEATHDVLPLLRVGHHNLSASPVVLGHADLLSLLGGLDVVPLVDLVLDGEAVAVPAEAAGAVVACLRCVSRHGVLDGSGGDVAVVGQSRGEGGPIIEGVGLPALGKLELLFEGVDLLPVLEDVLLLHGEVGSLGDLGEFGVHVVVGENGSGG
mmetsp:Transcript_8452/g.14176  ORF Transcript_8452/g.14176 Transcript_8452/m.14176 type:complete len:410 (-) Transcript_8452:186-1415(-)